MFYGIVKPLTDIRHYPELKKNLISLGMFDHNGYTFKEEGEVIKV